MRQIVAAAVLLLGGTVAVYAAAPTGAGAEAAPAPIRLAILPGEGERAPAEEVIAQLEVALTNEKDVALLERAQVRKILAEQKLSASGLSDPATAVRLGKLLSVEMFLFIDRMEKVSPPTCRVQAVEAATGVALAAEILAEGSLGQKTSPVTVLLDGALAKQQTPPADRRYVALLEMRNEEPSRSLDAIAIAAAMLLTTDLGRLPDVVVLERERMERLTAEKSLTGAQLALKASSTLIVGSVRRAAEPERLSFGLELRAPGKAAGTKVTVETPANDIAQLRRLLLEAVTQALGAKSPADGKLDRKQEALAFAGRVRPLAFYGDCEAATRAGEAAYALWPSDETRNAAFAGWYHYQFWCNTHNPHEVATQELALKAAIRRCTLFLEQQRNNPRSNAIPFLADDCLPPRRRSTPELQQLHDELRAVSRDMADTEMQRRRDNFTNLQAQFYYWKAAMHRDAIDFKERGFDDLHFVAIGERLKLFLNPPGVTAPQVEERLLVISILPSAMTVFLPGMSRHDEGDVRAKYVALWREWLKNPDPVVRLFGHQALIVLGDDPTERARSMLNLFLKELPLEHPWRNSHTDYVVFVQTMECPLQRLPAKEAADYCRQLCEPWLKACDALRLVCWNRVLDNWLLALQSQQRYAEADTLCQQVVEIMQVGDWSKEDRSSEAGYIIANLSQRRRGYATKTGTTPRDLWAQYTIVPLPGKLGAEVNTSLVVGDLLFCMGQTLGKMGYTYYVGAWKLPDGTIRNSTESLFVPSKDRIEFPVTGLAWSGERLYASTPLGLLEYKPGEKLRLLTEADGVPATDLTAVAWFAGRLYLGVGSRTYGKFGFATFDPATGKGEMLTSSGAAKKRSPLDGIRHRVQSLLPDTAGKAIWLSIRECDQRGLWRYRPDTGEFEQVVRDEWPPEGSLSWCGDRILYCIEPGLVLLTPDTREKTWLMGTYGARRSPFGITGNPLMTYPAQVYLPAWYDGAVLMARTNTDTNLRIFVAGQGDFMQNQLQSIIALHDTAYGIVAISSNGRTFLIKKERR